MVMIMKDRSRFIYPSCSCQCRCCERGIRNKLVILDGNNNENLAEKRDSVYLECLEGKNKEGGGGGGGMLLCRRVMMVSSLCIKVRQAT